LAKIGKTEYFIFLESLSGRLFTTNHPAAITIILPSELKMRIPEIDGAFTLYYAQTFHTDIT